MTGKTSFCIFLCFFVFLSGCSSMGLPHLITTDMKDEKIEGRSFRLILYGRTHGEDLESIALLDPEDDEFEIVPYAREYRYVIRKNLSADKAFEEAVRFARSHHSFMQTRVIRITDRQGKVFGYEIRPLYQFLRFGTSDVLDTSYVLNGSKIDAYISVKPALEDMFERDKSANDN